MALQALPTIDFEKKTEPETADTWKNFAESFQKFASTYDAVFQAESDRIEFQGMSMEQTVAQVTKIINDPTKAKWMMLIFIWISKGLGTFKAEKLDKYVGGADIKQACKILEIYKKEEGRTLHKSALTAGRIAAACHVYIIDMIFRRGTKMKPVANIVLYTDADFGAFGMVLYSTFGPYLYEEKADSVDKKVYNALLEWAVKHHDVVNPPNKQTGQQRDFSRNLFDTKIRSSRVAVAGKSKVTADWLVVLTNKGYTPGSIFATSWTKWVVQAANTSGSYRASSSTTTGSSGLFT